MAERQIKACIVVGDASDARPLEDARMTDNEVRDAYNSAVKLERHLSRILKERTRAAAARVRIHKDVF